MLKNIAEIGIILVPRLCWLLRSSTRGTPFIQSNVRKEFNSILDAACLPRIRIHDLRHTVASLMLNHGIPVIVVSRRLGHSNASVTLNVYAHTMVDMQNEAAMLMDELITPIPVDLPKGDMAIDVENPLHPRSNYPHMCYPHLAQNNENTVRRRYLL
jgi:hypothetical protein